MSDLARSADDLRDEVKQLRLAVVQLGARTARAEKVSIRAATAAAVLLLLVGLIGWVVWQQRQTADALESLTQRSLCPVFALVVGGYDPSTRPEGPAREQYQRTFEVMRQAYGELRCASPLVPPREDS